MPDLLEPSQLSRELREEASPDLAKRRVGIGLSLVGAVLAGAVTAYQTGLIRRLPDILPGKIWDAEKVDASDYAYQFLQGPDGPLMLANYGLTAMALAAGGKDRATQNPTLSFLATGKAAADFATCLVLARQEWRENKKLCSYCQVATVISAATLALSLPEAVSAARGGETVH